MSISDFKSLSYEHPLDENGQELSRKVRMVHHAGQTYFIKQRTVTKHVDRPYALEDCDEVELLTFFKGLGIFEELVDHDNESYVVEGINGERMHEFIGTVRRTRENLGLVGKQLDGYEVEEVVTDFYAKMLYSQILGVAHGESTLDNVLIERKRDVRFIDVERSTLLDGKSYEIHENLIDTMVADLSYWTNTLSPALPFAIRSGLAATLGKRIAGLHQSLYMLSIEDRREYLWKHIRDYVWDLYADFEEHDFPEEMINKVIAKYIVLASPLINSKGQFVSSPFDLENGLWNELKESSILTPFLSLAFQQNLTSQHHPDRVLWYESQLAPYISHPIEGSLEFEILQEIRSRS